MSSTSSSASSDTSVYLDRLAKVFTARGDSEQAGATTERANDLREAQKAGESQSETEDESVAS